MAYLSTTNFSEDKDFIDKWLYTIRTGEMDLSWMKAVTEKISPEEANPRRGLTYRDLNTLAHFGEQLKIQYDDPDGHDKLYRFMESIQEFFDLSSKLEVSFN